LVIFSQAIEWHENGVKPYQAEMNDQLNRQITLSLEYFATSKVGSSPQIVSN
jgi:hypothetical protein